MINSSLTAECNKIFNFWKLEEYFTPSDYPALVLTIKEGNRIFRLMRITMITVSEVCH